jgi:hypothetical protein
MQKTVVVMEDDLDGSEATQTIAFSVDGTDLQIDLSDKNADEFRKALEPYITAAQLVGGRARQSRRGRTRKVDGPVDTKAVRAWAASNGIDVSSRGRIPAGVLQQYRDAGN